MNPERDASEDVTETPTPAGNIDADRGRIVVGVDDSEQAAAALRWALAEGVLRSVTVEVLHTWSPPVSALPFGATLTSCRPRAGCVSAARCGRG